MIAFIFQSSGRGWIVPLATVIALSGSDYLCREHFSDADYYAAHGWPKLVAFWVAAMVIQALVYVPKDELIGVQPTLPARKPLLRPLDKFLYIPAPYWPAILFGCGILFYFVRF